MVVGFRLSARVASDWLWCGGWFDCWISVGFNVALVSWRWPGVGLALVLWCGVGSAFGCRIELVLVGLL